MAGTATLAGSLHVSFMNLGSGLFAPQAGNMFEIISAAGGITGQFTAMLPALGDGLLWQVMKTETAFRSRPSRPRSFFAGDYNLNGIVDIADYTVWRDTFGLTGSALAADGNADEMVDDLDYHVWKITLWRMSPNGAGSIRTSPPQCRNFFRRMLLVIGALLVFASRTRNHR